MTGITIPVSANFDGANAEKEIAKLNAQLNALGQAVANANKVKFNPVGTASLAELKAIEAKFQELTRISGAMRDRIKATGQNGSTFGGLDWNALYGPDPALRDRKMQQAYQHVTAGTSYAITRPPTAPGGAPPAPPPPPSQSGQPPPLPPHGPGFGSTLGGIAGAGLRATGPVGGVVANAAGAGMAGGLGAGVFGLLGGLAALAVGKGVAAIKSRVDAAGQEGIGYDTLKRNLGDVNVGFNLLRASLRGASNNIDVTFEEAQRLGTDFAKLSGMTKEQSKTLADEVSIGGGFGRSYGIDPSQSNQAFAQMRLMGVTQNTNDSRKLALMIGEAVAKSGSFSRADEVLQAIASFTTSQSRHGLASANVEGYAGTLSGLLGSRTPGLDPQGAAALLSRVNGSIAGGGAAGEAGQNFLFSLLGKRHGLDPVQAAMLQQQGAFGSGKIAFGSDLYKKFTGKFGGGVSAGAAGSTETNLAAILGGTQRQYGGNPSLMLNATARLLGINENQAMALHTINPNNLGGMTGRMGRLNLNMGQLSSTGISALSQIEGGDRATLMGQADALRKHSKALSSGERAALDGAIAGGDTEKLRDILTELTYAREQESTDGSKTRESIQGVDKRIQELATHLVGPMNDMRNALVFMAGGGKRGATGIAEGVMRAESAERLENMGVRNSTSVEDQRETITSTANQIGALKENWRKRAPTLSATDFAAEGAKFKAKLSELELKKKTAEDRILELNIEIGRAVQEEKTKLEADVKKLKADSVGSAGSATSSKKQFEEKYGAAAERAGKAIGVDKKLVLAQWGVETGWGKSIIPGSNNLGNIKDFSGGGIGARDNATGGIDKYRQFSSTDEFADHYVGLMNRRYKGVLGAGSDGGKFGAGLRGYAEDPDYVGKVVRSSNGLFSTPLPAGADKRTGMPDDQKVTVEGNFTLSGPGGNRLAEPVTVKKTVQAPRASGV